MITLIPLPYRIAALALIFVVSNGVSFYRGYHTGYGFSEARYAKALAAAAAQAAAKQKALADGVQRAAEEAYNAQAEADARVAAADAAVDSLRAALFTPRTGDGSAATPGFDASALGSIIADCAGQYRDVAKAADRLRAQVIGLQSYARAVSK